MSLFGTINGPTNICFSSSAANDVLANPGTESDLPDFCITAVLVVVPSKILLEFASALLAVEIELSRL